MSLREMDYSLTVKVEALAKLMRPAIVTSNSFDTDVKNGKLVEIG